MSRLEQLTPEQEALLPVVRDEWLRIGLCTDRADRPAAEAGVAAAYRAAGLEPPRIKVWLGSPMAGCIGAAMADHNNFTGRLVDQVARQIEGEVWDQAADQIWDEVREQAGRQYEDWPGKGVWAEAGNQVWDWALEEAEELFHGRLVRIRDDAWGSVEGQVRDQVWKTVADQVRSPAWDQVWKTVAEQVRNQIWELGEEQEWYRRDREKVDKGAWGQHDAAALSIFDVFRRFGLPGAERLDGHASVARAAGWWWPFRDAVILTERPAELHLDDQGRLHHPDRMAIQYPDGWGFHAWHGRRVPSWVTQSPTIEQITAERDTDVRRCAIEAMGWPAFLAAAEMTAIDRCADPDNAGHDLVLYDVPREIWGDPIRVLVCTNGTTDDATERDGTRRVVGLTVPVDVPDALSAAARRRG